jgi:hypothetical protein
MTDKQKKAYDSCLERVDELYDLSFSHEDDVLQKCILTVRNNVYSLYSLVVDLKREVARLNNTVDVAAEKILNYQLVQDELANSLRRLQAEKRSDIE